MSDYFGGLSLTTADVRAIATAVASLPEHFQPLIYVHLGQAQLPASVLHAPPSPPAKDSFILCKYVHPGYTPPFFFFPQFTTLGWG